MRLGFPSAAETDLLAFLRQPEAVDDPVVVHTRTIVRQREITFNPRHLALAQERRIVPHACFPHPASLNCGYAVGNRRHVRLGCDMKNFSP
jgi:hypothetical protein